MRNDFARLAALLGCAALVAVAATSSARGETIDREFREEFDVAVGDSLELQFGDGDVTVSAWDRDVLEVHVRYHADQRAIGFSKGDRRDFTVDFERQGDVIRVIGREPGGRVGIGIFTNRRHEYLYTVRAPSYLALDLKGDDGDVRIEGWASPISLISDDGNLDLANSRGDLRLRLEDGDVLIAEHEGSLDLRLDDGDVEINGCRAELVTIEVEDGDVDLARCEASFDITADDGDVYLDRVRSEHVDVRTADGNAILDVDSAGPLQLEVRTNDGDVDLDLGPGVSARFVIDTSDGAIRVDGPAVELSRDRSHATGSVGDGAGTIRILADDGSVTLRQAEAAARPAERTIGEG